MILTRIDLINNVRCRMLKRGVWLVIVDGLAVGRIFKYGRFKWRRYSRRGIDSLAAMHSVQNFLDGLNQRAA
jgi:hypothetical protein